MKLLFVQQLICATLCLHSADAGDAQESFRHSSRHQEPSLVHVYICHVTCPCYLLLPSAPWVLHCMPPRYPLQSTLALFLYNAGRLILNTYYSVNSECPSKLGSDPFKEYVLTNSLLSVIKFNYLTVKEVGRCYRLNYVLKFICWSPNPQYLRRWLCLEIGPFKGWLS